jgi:hypothetical protein
MKKLLPAQNVPFAQLYSPFSSSLAQKRPASQTDTGLIPSPVRLQMIANRGCFAQPEAKQHHHTVIRRYKRIALTRCRHIPP